jgi:hypothetical protein
VADFLPTRRYLSNQIINFTGFTPTSSQPTEK